MLRKIWNERKKNDMALCLDFKLKAISISVPENCSFQLINLFFNDECKSWYLLSKTDHFLHFKEKN